MATKKRKLDKECRIFNKEWGEKYFFVEVNGQRASCIICHENVAVMKEYNIRRHYETKHLSTHSKYVGKLRTEKFESMKHGLESQRNLFTKQIAENESITRASYKIVNRMVERGKPFTDGKLIKECIIEAVNDLCPEKASLFENISLSASTVVRRTEELGENIQSQIHEKAKDFLWYSLAMDESTDLSSTSQLLVFIRGVNCNFEITEELASVCSMHERTTGEDIFMEVQKTLQSYHLQWNQLRCVTVDGGKNMAGKKKGLIGQIQAKLGDLLLPRALSIHCIIHQQSLCGKHLDISCVLKPVTSVVNFIRNHGLNHRLFQAFLEEIDSDFCDLPYYTAVRWLSCGKVLLRFYNLRREIDLFLTEQNRADPLFSDPSWLSKLSFLVDITSHMNELNLKLQGKENLICELYRNITAFRRKLSLFEAQLEGGNFSHFQCFQEFCTENAGRDVNLEFQKKIIQDLQMHFSERFSDLDQIENDIRLFENPFGCNLENTPTELQLELIDLQVNTLLKEKHREGKLIEFYRCLPDDDFSKLKKFAAGMASVFGTTYVCEQTFSRMNYVKSMYRTRLSDEHLKAILMVGCSNHKANLDILKMKHQFHTSH